jgi:DNA-directed RNA polymerase subunit RPC12/RpoP
MEIVIGIFVMAGLIVGGFLIFGRKKKVEEPAFFYFNCSKCRRRLRYLEKQQGRQGACPTCKTAIIFPAVGPR